MVEIIPFLRWLGHSPTLSSNMHSAYTLGIVSLYTRGVCSSAAVIGSPKRQRARSTISEPVL